MIMVDKLCDFSQMPFCQRPETNSRALHWSKDNSDSRPNGGFDAQVAMLATACSVMIDFYRFQLVLASVKQYNRNRRSDGTSIYLTCMPKCE
jgi:hypothetical protein